MASLVFNAVFGVVLVAISPQLESIFGTGTTVPPKTYTVNVGIGGGLRLDDNLGGNTPGVAIWTARGDPIGVQFGSPDLLADGSLYTVQIPGNNDLGNGEAQVEYVSITNGGDDDICVSHVAVTDPLGGKQVFLGDTGRTCDVPWYPSTTTVDSKKIDCIWIGRKDSDRVKFQGMGIHMPSFSFPTMDANPGLLQEYQELNATMCGSGPRWRMYENLRTEDPILRFDPPLTSENYTADGADLNVHSIIGNGGVMTNVDRSTKWIACSDEIGIECEQGNFRAKDRKRSQSAERVRHNNSNGTSHGFRHLIKSHHPQHSASDLCKSGSSYGPDFVSVPEMKFCDMSMKKLWDVCQGKSSTCCMDLNSHTMRGCSAKVDKNVFAVPHKNYTSVKEWNV